MEDSIESINQLALSIGPLETHLLWADFLGLPLCSLPLPCRVRPSFTRLSLRPMDITDGGTESLAISAGETRDPSRAIPRVVRTVFFRCVIDLRL